MGSAAFPEKGLILANEFAEVKVEVDYAAKLPRLKITDLGTGLTACLDPLAAFSERGVSLRHESVEVRMEVDHAANGPRLEITELDTGQSLFFDPLQLSDAAVTGTWGKFPAIYDDLDLTKR